MRRRELITLLCGAAAAWPRGAWGQQARRRVGVLMTTASNDTEGQARLASFLQGLKDLGWSDGANVNIDVRWTEGRPATLRAHIAEMQNTTQPEVLLAPGSATVTPLLQLSPAIPIVFVNVVDPVGAGFVESLARPGGHATGFTQYEYGTSAKWLELLKQVAPHAVRAGVLRDPGQPSGLGQFAAIQSAAPTLNIIVSPIDVRTERDIERGIVAFARTANGGLIVTGSALAVAHRDLIISLAARHKLPAVYYERFFVAAGGLVAYGPDLHDQYRQAAGYVDRILRGEKPADLPVQSSTKYQLALNLKTARALGITVPPTLLARADEVIE